MLAIQGVSSIQDFMRSIGYDPNQCRPARCSVSLESLKSELESLNARKAKVESMIQYVEANPGALEVLQELAR